MVTSNGILKSESEPNSSLDNTQRARLKELEAIVEQEVQTFYQVGKALEEIREHKLYRETHKTFEAYCQDKWGIARQTANRLISAARVTEILEPIGSKIPKKENQVRPLNGLAPELQIEIWQEAVALAPNGVPTGALVKRLVEERTSGLTVKQASRDAASELEKLRLENKNLKEQMKQNALERERRAAEVADELERLREENRQVRAEIRQWERDWDVRIAQEREKIRQELRVEIREELRVEIREEVKAEYEGQINTLTTQVTSLTQQLADMTAKYEGVLARLEAIERGNK